MQPSFRATCYMLHITVCCLPVCYHIMVLNTRIQDHSKFKFPTFSLCETYIELLHFRLGLLKSESVGISIREARFWSCYHLVT